MTLLAVVVTSAVGRGQVQIFRVDGSAMTMGTGASWASPINDLQTALTMAEVALGSSPLITEVQVWVRAVAAPYRVPDSDVNAGAMPVNQRDRAFRLFPGTRVYGGFDGTELTLLDRVGLFRATVLDGDFANTPNDPTDDAYTVVFIPPRPGTALLGTRLDGFQIRNGNANGIGTNFPGAFVGGPANERDAGGGVYVQGATVVFDNLYVFANRASTWGGGICFRGDGEGVESLGIVTSTFFANSASLGGGVAIRYRGNFALPQFFERAHIYNCIFARNLGIGEDGAPGAGGALWVGARDSNPLYVCNTQFLGNVTDGVGSAACISQDPGVATLPLSPVIFGHCTMTQNVAIGPPANGPGNTVFYQQTSNVTNMPEEIDNSILWGNVDRIGSDAVGPPTVFTGPLFRTRHSDIEQSTGIPVPGDGNIHVNPLFVSYFNFRLQAGSPCVDAGTDDLILPDWPDLDNNSVTGTQPVPFDWTGTVARAIDDPGATPVCPATAFTCGVTDMGAFERQP